MLAPPTVHDRAPQALAALAMPRCVDDVSLRSAMPVCPIHSVCPAHIGCNRIFLDLPVRISCTRRPPTNEKPKLSPQLPDVVSEFMDENDWVTVCAFLKVKLRSGSVDVRHACLSLSQTSRFNPTADRGAIEPSS